MSPKTKAALLFGAAALLCVAAWIPLRGLLQYRAIYPGGLTFIGQAEGPFGIRYDRVYCWRAPDDTSPLPEATIHLRGSQHRLDELTLDLLRGLGGWGEVGAVRDADGVQLDYRFEHGRLTYFSLGTAAPPRQAMPDAGNGRFHLQVGEGTPFLLPLSHRHLKACAGAPERTTRNLAN